ncbi:diaminobutyrate--2-oxoglutarate transaminase [Pseudomonas sp. Bc-h]|uniref:aspartate aminotransferase family protein n=1 Tax=Pseudomonas sp. Bc-h TaxID=1943632 RepID=UPI0009D9889A|nr:aspartate aminotransferase family protein [Pseudomonas sp. Bc-h]OQR26446.1 diaminobutyrate--2-oxoglutarate transaminase [Pseudomonas sp. Bc-h]
MHSQHNVTPIAELTPDAALANADYRFAPTPRLDRQAAVESNARSYPRRIPLELKRAQGIHVQDSEGRWFIDCLAGAGTLALGHNHPEVVQSMRSLLDGQRPLHTLDLMTEAKDEFINELFALLPPEFAKDARIQFCGPAGTDAVEAAMKLVRTATGRSNMMAFHGAYHGMTQGALGLMGNLGPKAYLGGLASSAQFLPFPYDYRCPFGVGGETGERIGLHYIENQLTDPESGVLPPAGMILETLQGEGGVVPTSANWLREVRRITREAGVPLILDEIQCGVARTGKPFAFQHADIVPDVLVLSKAIGGSQPMAVVVYNKSLDVWKPGSHAGTFRGNQLAMVAGSTTLRIVREQQLDQHAAAMGERLAKHLRALQKDYPQMGDVRGMGLMLGVEMVDPEGRPDVLGRFPQSGELASKIQRQCLRRGLIIEVGGRRSSVIRFLPPLIVTAAQIDQIAEIFGAAISAAVSQR